MRALVKYAIVLGSGVAVGLWLSGPRSVDLAGEPASSEAAAVVDTTAAPAAANEDLDYLIARRIGTLEAWQGFLSAHAAGDHADSATAEIDKLMLAMKASSPAAGEAENVAPEQTVVGEAAAATRPSEDSPRAAPQACDGRDGCSADSRDAPPADSLERVASAEPGDFGDQTATSSIGSINAAAVPIPPERADQTSGPRAAAPSRGSAGAAQAAPKRPGPRCVIGFGCHFTVHALPPILQALLGVKSRHPARMYRQVADMSAAGVRAR